MCVNSMHGKCIHSQMLAFANRTHQKIRQMPICASVSTLKVKFLSADYLWQSSQFNPAVPCLPSSSRCQSHVLENPQFLRCQGHGKSQASRGPPTHKLPRFHPRAAESGVAWLQELFFRICTYATGRAKHERAG